MSKAAFDEVANKSTVIPVVRRMMGDHLSPVLAYRRLVAQDERMAASFLFESVENGNEVGRFSFLGAKPAIEIIAKGNKVTIQDHEQGTIEDIIAENPLDILREYSKSWNVGEPIAIDDLPLPSFLGGWVGYASYDSARYFELGSLPFENAPGDEIDHIARNKAMIKTVH